MSESLAALPAAFLPALVELMPGGVVCYLPEYDAAGTLVDFRFAYLNPAAQRLLELPAQPAVSYAERFPASRTDGGLVYHRAAYLGGAEPTHAVLTYQAGGHDKQLQVAGQRVGDTLLVTFTDTADQTRAQERRTQAFNEELQAANEEIRANNDELTYAQAQLRQLNDELEARVQARTQEAQLAQQATEHQRLLLQRVLEQAPVAIAIMDGPTHVVTFANSRMGEIWGRPLAQALGQPHFAGLPDTAGQGLEAVFAGVYENGVPAVLREQLTYLDRARTGRAAPHYLHMAFEPLRDEQGRTVGIIASATDVTELVVARQQREAQESQTNTLNEELQAANEEILANNTALARTQAELHELNNELEIRVLTRTYETQVAQADAEQQRWRFERLVMDAPVAICVFDGPDWVYELVNPSYQQMFPGRQLLGLPLVEALPEVADQPLMDILRKVYETGVTFQSQEVLVPLARTADGPVEDIYFDLTYQARVDEQGHINGFITFANDVTEQVRARRQVQQLNEDLQSSNEALRVQQGLLSQILRQVPAYVATFSGPRHVYSFFNESFSQVLTQGRARLGEAIADLFPELVAQGYVALLDEVYASGQAASLPESKVVQRDPLTHEERANYVNVVYQPLRDEQGQAQGILAFAVDTTEVVLARQQVQRLNEELAAINEELQVTNEELLDSNRQLTRTNVDLDTFIYTASHDLKAPIANIESILLALREQLPPEAQQDEMVAQLLHLLDGTVARFQTTITQLTDLSRLQMAHAGPAEAVPLAALIDEVRQDLQPAIAEAGAQLTVRVAPELRVFFLPKTVRSVVYNLLSNAIKYRQPQLPAQVLVHAEQQPKAVVLTVRDNGLGLTPTQQGRLFGLFQRLHTHVEGTGVGLYLIKRLIENGGGTIAVESTPGLGSTFTVTFPTTGSRA